MREQLSDADHLWLIENYQKKLASVLLDERILAILSPYMPADFAIKRTALGRPYAKSAQELCPVFTLTHAGNYVVIFLSQNKPIGIDIELIKNRKYIKKIAHKYFKLNNFSVREFYQHWTAREAYIKAAGLRLFSGLREQDNTYEIIDCVAPENYVLSVCRLKKNNKKIVYFNVRL